MRETVCFSWYSDMSMRTIACSSSNRNSASARASSVLPTPVGPRKRNEPIGRVLPDHALAQRALHVVQALDLALEHLVDRDPGPLRHHGGDVVLGHLLAE